jgi:hypothetical protein
VDIICKLPLSNYRQKDVMIWRGTSSSEFSVHSAYLMEKERKDIQHGEGSKHKGYDIL